MSNKVITVDVRDDLSRGREPFGKIMQAVGALADEQDLLLIAPFEPKPLFGVLAQRGFAYRARSLANGDWEVLFSRNLPANIPASSVSPATQAVAGKQVACLATPVVAVDTRGLEPPQPLVKILEALATLPEGAKLRAHTDRRPMHLYSQVEERGFVGKTEQQTDGSFVTYVSRP